MKEALSASDFSLSELKTGLCTVYLVLPPNTSTNTGGSCACSSISPCWKPARAGNNDTPS